MTRLTRLLSPHNSPKIRSFVINQPNHRPNPKFSFLDGKTFPFSSQNRPPQIIIPFQIRPSEVYKFTTSTIPDGRGEPDIRATAMDSYDGMRSPESEEPPPAVVGDFENTNPDSELNVNLEGEGGAFNERKVLPEELSRNVMVLECESTAEGGSCDVYLVGTAHVSQESCRKVRAIIRYLKPEVVFLELCSSRVAVLTPQNFKVPTMSEVIDMLKQKQNAFGVLYTWFLAKVATKLEVFPGSEFCVAHEEAMKYGGKVILGDRPVEITLRRTWGKMPLWHKTKLLYSLLSQVLFLPSSEDLENLLKEMDDVDALTLVIQEMSKTFPTLMETLIHERDKYMSAGLLRVASDEHTSVVAVVGKGHLQGIKKYWKQPVEMKDIMEIPTQTPVISVRKIIASLGVAVAGVAIISGSFFSSKK